MIRGQEDTPIPRTLEQIGTEALEKYSARFAEKVVPLVSRGAPIQQQTEAIIAAFLESLPANDGERKMLLEALEQNSGQAPGDLVGAYTAWRASSQEERKVTEEGQGS